MRSNKEILEKAIQKAIDGGWELPGEAYRYKVQSHRVISLTAFSDEDDSPGYWRVSTNEIIFNHDFAKALWGESIDPVVVPHDVPAKRKDFKPWNNYTGEDFGDWSHVPDKLFDCANCGKTWGKSFVEINTTSCLPMFVEGKYGWKSHLRQMVTADDPIKYLGEHLDD